MNTYAKIRDYIEQYLINKNVWKPPQGSTFGLTKAANKVADDQGQTKAREKETKARITVGRKEKDKTLGRIHGKSQIQKAKEEKASQTKRVKEKMRKEKEKRKESLTEKEKEMWIKSPCRQAMSQLWEIWSHSRTMLVENRQCRKSEERDSHIG